ncbi:MAG: transglycosylase SLT domain-containing protein [Maritimibacter sp.]
MFTKPSSLLAALLAQITALFLLLTPAMAQDAASVSALKSALELMGDGEWDAALATAGPEGSVPRDIIRWNRLRASQGSFAEAQDFLKRRPDWPGLAYLHEHVEKTIPEDASHIAVLDFFLHQKPETGTGSLRFAKSLWETGAKQDAMAEAVRSWTQFSLSEEEEAQYMVDWPKTLSHQHWNRLDMLLWRGLTDQAKRMLPRVDAGHRALAQARIMLRDDENGVDDAIAAVPNALSNDPGLAYERMLWRARKGRNDDAIELILAQSGSQATLGNPASWAGWRLILARWAMREGKLQTAYRLAAHHHMASGNSRDELEWLAGYLALAKLSDPATALKHFQNFAAGVDSPISVARAGYWQGRALEALGRGTEAQTAYAQAGQNQTAFYGLLAAQKAGLAMDPALTGRESYPDYHQASFWNSSLMQAARLSLAADDLYLARRFTVQLSESLDATGLGQLTQWAEESGAPYLQLSLAKYALSYHDLLLNRPYFPTPDIGHGNRTVPRALEMAISRRESEFNPGALSRVGAMGLMQLMPGTARDMAKRVEISYEPDRLLSEMPYSTRLGSEYLAYLIEQFGNNPVLIAVGYNAGPGRVRQWIEAYGDPRDPGVDVVDWIENIPFNETMNYVMRVTESLPNYRARLTGQIEPIRFLEELKRR